jgi:hypothetical protein
MIKKIATDEQVFFTREFLKTSPLGKRNQFNGNEFQQFFGLLAQIIVTDELNLSRQVSINKFDGGYDFIYHQKKYDVKCEIRSISFKKHFIHNLAGEQINYEAEYYIFVSYNKTEGEFTICGFISKEDVKKKAKFYPFATKRIRDDGTTFEVYNQKGLFEIEQKHLKNFERLR